MKQLHNEFIELRVDITVNSSYVKMAEVCMRAGRELKQLKRRAGVTSVLKNLVVVI